MIVEPKENHEERWHCQSVGDLARWMQTVTEKHLSQYGLSRGELQKEGKIWVIAWTSAEIRRLPGQDEKMILRVWPGKMKGGMYVRRYAFYSTGGEPLACASSLFALMDSANRRLAKPSGQIQNIPVVTEKEEPALPKMLMPFPQELRGMAERVVRPDEIDQNGHLNNTHYIDWTEGLASEQCPVGSRIRSVWVQYNKELKEGQKVMLRYQYENETLYVRGYVEQVESFSAVLKMETEGE